MKLTKPFIWACQLNLTTLFVCLFVCLFVYTLFYIYIYIYIYISLFVGLYVIVFLSFYFFLEKLWKGFVDFIVEKKVFYL